MRVHTFGPDEVISCYEKSSAEGIQHRVNRGQLRD
jgi:hypothetical protein